LADSRKAELWSEHIVSYRNSGLSAINWCKKSNLQLGRLQYWISKFNKEKTLQEPEWISFNEPVTTVSIQLIKIKTGNISIEIPDGFRSGTLSSVLEVLGIHV